MPSKPTRADLLDAYGRKVPDLIAPDLKVLFCGINPSLYSAVVGHHFARPGNRFWPTLHTAGFTNRRLFPQEEDVLLQNGYGITNLVPRATAAADELTAEEVVRGGHRLLAKVRRQRPRFLAVLGVGAYRTAWNRPTASLGLQADTIDETKIWVLPNPSGLNAHYQLDGLATLYRALREAAS